MIEYRLLCDESIAEYNAKKQVWGVNAALYGRSAQIKKISNVFAHNINRRTKWSFGTVFGRERFEDIEKGLTIAFDAVRKNKLKLIFSYVHGRHTRSDFGDIDPLAHGQYMIGKRAAQRVSRISEHFKLDFETDASRKNSHNITPENANKISKLAMRRANFDGRFVVRYKKTHAQIQAADFLAGAFAYFANGGAAELKNPRYEYGTMQVARQQICSKMMEQWNDKFGLNLDPKNPLQTIKQKSDEARPRRITSWEEIPPVELIEIIPRSELAMRSYA